MINLRLTIFDKIILFIAFNLAIGLILGSLAGGYDPRAHILIAFFGLAYPFFLVLNLLVAAWWLIRGKWILVIATLVLVGFGWNTLVSTFGFFGDEGSEKKDSEHYVRLMTYNVHQFKPYGSNNDEPTKNQIIEVVKKENPDVVCFQEYYTRYKGAFDTTDSLKKMLKAPYYYFVPSVKNDYEAYGLAIFSKYPIKNKGSILFNSTYRGNESIYVDIEVENQLLRIYNVHFQSISFDKQDYQYLDMVTKEMNTEIKSSKRIASMLKTAFLKRSEQVDIMKENLQACTIPYVIAGDFNDTPASYAVTQITKSLNNAFTKKGQGFGKTYNGKFPNFQIDYIATTKEFDVINYHITKAKLSDHFPVRSDLRLNASMP
jgi:endonuclease/exonuclease/phosphatase family metal-dependent hydrolase